MLSVLPADCQVAFPFPISVRSDLDFVLHVYVAALILTLAHFIALSKDRFQMLLLL